MKTVIKLLIKAFVLVYLQCTRGSGMKKFSKCELIDLYYIIEENIRGIFTPASLKLRERDIKVI
jgi:hypothetical protein